MRTPRACSSFYQLFGFVLPLLGTLLLPASSYGNEFRHGLRAYLDGDYQTALAVWEPLASQGNAAAQHSLGTLYDGGRGVAQDYARAAEWFRLAAEQGHASAQFRLGDAHYHGRGVVRDQRLAEGWWLRAASQEFVPAQTSLTNLYQAGRGKLRNQAQAQKWYRQAATNGSRTTQQLADEPRRNVVHPMSHSLPIDGSVLAVASPRHPSSADDRQVRREAWILRQRPEHYALQLAAGENERNIVAFINRHNLAGEAAYFRFNKDGDDWYSLLYGDYANYAQAKQALDALPSHLHRNRPWVRTLASVQESIAAAQTDLAD